MPVGRWPTASTRSSTSSACGSPTRWSSSAGPANAPAGGTVTISDTTPAENQTLTASEAVTDANGVNRATLTFAWQAEEGDGGWTTVATGATFTPGDGEVGSALRVVATFNDGDGVLESVDVGGRRSR